MKLSKLTMQAKILLTLSLTSTVLLLSPAVFSSSSQRALVTDIAYEKVDYLMTLSTRLNELMDQFTV